MNQSEIMDIIVNAVENKQNQTGFSEMAREVVGLFEKWKMFTSSFSLNISDDAPASVREAIESLRAEIICKMNCLTDADVSGNADFPSNISESRLFDDSDGSSLFKQEFQQNQPQKDDFAAYIDFQGYTPKPEPVVDSDDSDDFFVPSEKHVNDNIEENNDIDHKPLNQQAAFNKIPDKPQLKSLNETGASPMQKNETMPTIAELLKSNLDKALALKNAEFTRDRMLLSFMPAIIESIKAGLGIELIYQNVTNAGFAGGMDELVNWLKQQSPTEMAQYICQTPGCNGVIMKRPLASNYTLEMKWMCPVCNKIHDHID